MAYIRAWLQPWPRWHLSGVLLLILSTCTQALQVTYCSPDNGSGNNYIQSTYMSNGKCQDNCKGSYVFAVIQGQECWCSNYAPADQVSTSQCSDACPGYPIEQCGNTALGLYGYFNLGGSASGTVGSGSSASRTSSPSSSIETSSSSLTSSASMTTEPTQVYTSIISVTGKVSTVVITPTPAQTADSALGASAQSNGGGSGLSGGAVAGIVIGVAIIIGLAIGGFVFWFLRRRHQKNLDAVSEATSYTPPSQASKSNGGIPSRQVSQMSSAGLLTRPSRMNTGGLTSDDPRNAGNGTALSDRNSTHMTVDQRLNPWAIYSSEESRASNVSLQDNQDYSRQLRVANPDP